MASNKEEVTCKFDRYIALFFLYRLKMTKQNQNKGLLTREQVCKCFEPALRYWLNKRQAHQFLSPLAAYGESTPRGVSFGKLELISEITNKY